MEADDKYLQYVSDIHLEFRKNKYPMFKPIVEGKSYLALLGDIGYPTMDNYKNFIEYHSKLFVQILIISGNHEYYTSKKKQNTIEDIEKLITEITQLYPNVTYLQKSSIQIGNTLFLGCTLWTELKDFFLVEISMNDYQNIYVKADEITRSRKVYTTGCNYNVTFGGKRRSTMVKSGREKLSAYNVWEKHEDMRDWIFNTLDNVDENIDVIVLTHHAPIHEMLNNDKDDLAQCYASHLNDKIEKYSNLDYWLSGHTHLCKEVDIGYTKFKSNCMGHNSDKIGEFDSNKFVVFK